MKRNLFKSNINIFNLLFVFAVFSFLATIALPTTIFYLNPSLTWDGIFWIKIFIVFILLGFPVLFLLNRVSSHLSYYLYILFLTLSAYLIIRGYFLPIQYGSLDGVAKEKVAIISDSSLYLSLTLVIIIFFCLLLKQKFTKNLIFGGFIGIFCFIAFVYVKTIINNKQNGLLENENSLRYTSLSKNKNIIVLSFDSVQGDLFFKTIEENPKLKEIFDGFTLYSDVLSYAPGTTYSLLSTLTGKEIPVSEHGTTTQSLYNHMYDFSIASYLNNHGYNDSVYMPEALKFITSSTQNEIKIIDNNLLKKHLKITKDVLSAYDVEILRITPISISPYVLKLITLIKLNIDKETDLKNLIAFDGIGLGFGNDLIAFENMYKSPNFIEKPVFKFYHYLFTHEPVRFNKTCKYSTDTLQTYTSASEEVICMIQEMNNYISMLKKNHVYDNTFLIITSDHGYSYKIQPTKIDQTSYYERMVYENGSWHAGRYWPLLLVKNFHDSKKLRINNEPISLLDIAPTIYSQAINDNKESRNFDGVDLMNNVISVHRQRKLIYYAEAPDNFNLEDQNTKLYKSAEVSGDRQSGLLNLYKKISMQKTLKCGDTIEFNQYSKNYFILGLYRIAEVFRWSDDKNIALFFLGDKTACANHKITLELGAFFGKHYTERHAEVFLNNQKIGEVNISITDKRPKKNVFFYPKNIYKINEENILELKIDGEIFSPKELGISDDYRKLALAFYSLNIR